MTDADVIAALDDRCTLGLTAWAEARATPRDDDSHSPIEGLVAVMVVVRNRRAQFARWRATDASYKAVCLAPNQFSCWNPGTDRNHVALMAQARILIEGVDVAGHVDTMHPIDPLLLECLYLADGVISGALLDRTGSANSYWAPAAMVPAGRVPSWAVGLAHLQIGTQLFVSVNERSA